MSDQTNNPNDDGENKPMKIVFAEGCFDDFEGTQEELDELVAHIQSLAESGELFDKAVPLDDTVTDAAVDYDVDEYGYVKYPFDTTTRQ